MIYVFFDQVNSKNLPSMTYFKPIVLASSSLYKRQIFEKLQIDFISKNPQVIEQAFPGESPANLAKRLAKEKAQALCAEFDQHLIIGSDQVAIYKSMQLTKPGNKEKAIEQLQLMSGNSIDFYTSLCLIDSSNKALAEDINCCSVKFRSLSLAEIERYLDLDQPFDCAGSFKSEGLGIALIESITSSDPNALIGLPLIKLVDLLASFGVKVLR